MTTGELTSLPDVSSLLADGGADGGSAAGESNGMGVRIAVRARGPVERTESLFLEETENQTYRPP